MIDLLLFGVDLQTRYIPLTSISAIYMLKLWVDQYTWHLYEIEPSWNTTTLTLA